MLTADPLIADQRIALFRDAPRPGWGAPASLLVHVLALVLLVLVGLAPRRIEAPDPSGIAVDLIGAAQFRALTAPAPAPLSTLVLPDATTDPLAAPAVPDGPRTPAPASAPASPRGPIRATRFFASDILAHDRRIAAALTTLGPDERVVQLCNVEALEQIRIAARGTAPDTMVAYAMADMDVRGPTLTADGGAFRSRRTWFAIAFTCTVALDFSHVEAFEFTLGDPIPRDLWEEHFLTESEAEE